MVITSRVDDGSKGYLQREIGEDLQEAPETPGESREPDQPDEGMGEQDEEDQVELQEAPGGGDVRVPGEPLSADRTPVDRRAADAILAQDSPAVRRRLNIPQGQKRDEAASSSSTPRRLPRSHPRYAGDCRCPRG